MAAPAAWVLRRQCSRAVPGHRLRSGPAPSARPSSSSPAPAMAATRVSRRWTGTGSSTGSAVRAPRHPLHSRQPGPGRSRRPGTPCLDLPPRMATRSASCRISKAPRGRLQRAADQADMRLIDPRSAGGDPAGDRRCKLLLSEALHGVIVADAMRVRGSRSGRARRYTGRNGWTGRTRWICASASTDCRLPRSSSGPVPAASAPSTLPAPGLGARIGASRAVAERLVTQASQALIRTRCRNHNCRPRRAATLSGAHDGGDPVPAGQSAARGPLFRPGSAAMLCNGTRNPTTS